MVLAYLLLFLPAFALSKESVAIVPAEDLKVCEYFDARIIRLGEIVNKELLPDVDVSSDLYIILEESKLCDTVGYVAIPECVANKEGDECVARKTSELIRKSLRAAMKAEKIKDLPSGEKFFATCKHIGYKNVLKTFNSARTLMSAECGLPGLGGGRSRRNSDLLPALLLGGSYDPSSIWFQYFLCKDIDLYCYFFTQGWTQGQYGQYYLYDNLLDDQNGLFAGSSDSSNLATIALLGGLGGGIGQSSGYYPSYGAHAAPASAQGRKRREGSTEDDVEDDEVRKRRETCEDANGNAVECSRNRRGIEVEEEDEEGGKRERRETCYNKKGEKRDCNRKRREEEVVEENEDGKRTRRETCYNEKGEKKDCNRKRREEDVVEEDKEGGKRKRRETCYNEMGEKEDCNRKRRSPCEDENGVECDRKRRNACEACDDNNDSVECANCYR